MPLLLASLAAALLASGPGPDPGGTAEPRCASGWVNYDRPADFEPGSSRLRGLARQNLVLLAIQMSKSGTPVFIQSGGGASADPVLSERRSAAVRALLAAQGVDSERVRVVPGKAGQSAPDGLLVYSHISRDCD